MHSEPFCPRQISFLLPGQPSVRVTATETGTGAIDFVVDVENQPGLTADLRGLFFHLDPAQMAGLAIAGAGPLVSDSLIAANGVLDLGQGANLTGFAQPFDVGVEFGTPGPAADLVDGPVSFTLTNAANTLTLDHIAGQQFGARLDAVSGGGSRADGSTKLLGTAPAAPDAVADNLNIFEDGATGLNAPSKTPTAVTLNVLANDTDADTPLASLLIESIHNGPQHGTAVISADGKSILYTPNLDFSGNDSFEYCITDGSGGQDSAVCNVTVAAVADLPVITYSVEQGANINEILINVTATQNDADGSEFVDDIVLSVAGGLPAGASIAPPSEDPAGSPNAVSKQFVVQTAAETDYDFDIRITATSQEASNADQQEKFATQSIEIEFNENQESLEYEIEDQNIWATGDAFMFHQEPFFGFEKSVASSGGDPDIIDTSYDVALHVRTGFQAVVEFSAGDIDASIPVDVTIDTTYNKTTDAVLISPLLALGAGGTFSAQGPEGLFKLDFVFEFDGHAFAQILGVELIDTSWDYDYVNTLIDVDSADAAVTFNPIPGVVSVGFAWPHITTTNDPDLLSGTGESNDFLSATLDVDALANYLLGGALSFIDPDPLDPGNLELLDADITGALKLIQEFGIALQSQGVNLVLEDGAVVPMTFGSPMMITGASAHDANGDGTLAFSFDLSPKLNLTNDTEVGVDIDMYLALGKNVPVVGTIYEDTFELFGTSIDVYEATFPLAGVGTQSVNFTIA